MCDKWMVLPTDQLTDGWTDTPSYRHARTHLKSDREREKVINSNPPSFYNSSHSCGKHELKLIENQRVAITVDLRSNELKGNLLITSSNFLDPYISEILVRI